MSDFWVISVYICSQNLHAKRKIKQFRKRKSFVISNKINQYRADLKKMKFILRHLALYKYIYLHINASIVDALPQSSHLEENTIEDKQMIKQFESTRKNIWTNFVIII